ncbi:hypothetical protein CAOG_01303 [Capsaspora owczarzaki ATCC 30864]|nr:hypothetical protein CAOG_01303 [Capsaspora owczarzaki ATCC 30864]|eukprot:XP_004349823.2 hypothetical protein CAOG_01303 [Capsaspora owczarzaki ATCC 30864]
MSDMDEDDIAIDDPRRANHNALERKRRIFQKDRLQELKRCVPFIKDAKSSTVEILQKSTEYIAYLRSKQTEQDAQLQSMRAIQKYLVDKLRECTNGAVTLPDIPLAPILVPPPAVVFTEPEEQDDSPPPQRERTNSRSQRTRSSISTSSALSAMTMNDTHPTPPMPTSRTDTPLFVGDGIGSGSSSRSSSSASNVSSMATASSIATVNGGDAANSLSKKRRHEPETASFDSAQHAQQQQIHAQREKTRVQMQQQGRPRRNTDGGAMHQQPAPPTSEFLAPSQVPPARRNSRSSQSGDNTVFPAPTITGTPAITVNGAPTSSTPTSDVQLFADFCNTVRRNSVSGPLPAHEMPFHSNPVHQQPKRERLSESDDGRPDGSASRPGAAPILPGPGSGAFYQGPIGGSYEGMPDNEYSGRIRANTYNGAVPPAPGFSPFQPYYSQMHPHAPHGQPMYPYQGMQQVPHPYIQMQGLPPSAAGGFLPSPYVKYPRTVQSSNGFVAPNNSVCEPADLMSHYAGSNSGSYFYQSVAPSSMKPSHSLSGFPHSANADGRRLQGHAEEADEDDEDAESSSDGSEHNGRRNGNSSTSEDIRCVCGSTAWDGKFMLACDKCQKWLHGDCVNVRPRSVPKVWHCPSCASNA